MKLDFSEGEREAAIEEGLLSLLYSLADGIDYSEIGYYCLHKLECVYRFEAADVDPPFLIVEKYTADDERVQ